MLGVTITTCLFEKTEINADLIATSVLPNPTSPHKTRFIGLIKDRSFFIDSNALIWSGVSINGNSDSNLLSVVLSTFKLTELDLFLLDSISRISAAWSIALFLALFFLLDHLVEDNESNLTLLLWLFLW